MKTLLLLRHAKAKRDDPQLSDHERPLKKRGRRDCDQVGELLVEQRIVPDLIISSTAERARDTAERTAKAAGYEHDIEEKDELYLARPEKIIEVLRQVDSPYQCVMVVAHNPGLEELTNLLSGQSLTLPTAGLAQFEVNVDRWQDLAADNAQLVQLWRPKELDEEA